MSYAIIKKLDWIEQFGAPAKFWFLLSFVSKLYWTVWKQRIRIFLSASEQKIPDSDATIDFQIPKQIKIVYAVRW